MPHSQRQNWGKQHKILPELDLIKLQKESYQDFLDHGIEDSLNQVNA